MKAVLLLILTFSVQTIVSQTSPRTWKDHLGIPNCNSVSKLGNKIYASNSNGIFWFDEDEINPKALNKINGLTDVGIKLLRTNPNNNKLLVIYNNSNIDIIDVNGNVSNYSDIKLKTLSGKKYINEVFFYNQFAYLACGFGIIVFDTEKLEVKDTYIIGPNASNIEVFQVALNDSLIFAATENGLYVSNHKTKALNNFNNWKRESTLLPAGPYGGVVSVGNKILACYSPSRINNFTSRGKDTLYMLSNNTWSRYFTDLGKGTTIYRFGPVYGNLFSVIDLFGLAVREVESGRIENIVYEYTGVSSVFISDVYFDKDYSNNISYWLADRTHGLYQYYLSWVPTKRVDVNGMRSRMIGAFDVYNGQVAVAPSYADVTGVAPPTREGINILKDKEWKYVPAIDDKGNEILGIGSVLFDRKDKTRMWAAAWYYGVIEYKDNKVVSVRNASNTNGEMPLKLPGQPRCNGLSMDKDGNVWFTTSDQINYLNVIRRSNGEYKNFKLDAVRFSRKTFVDRNNNVWVVHEGSGGITVFKPNNFVSPTYKILTKEVGKGNLQSNAVIDAVEDKEGRVWVGTEEGISVFYNTSAIFGSGDYDSQPIKIVQDGNVELLLGKEKVTSLDVDGANNKWVGTATGGVYCFSPDGQSQLYHFTAENSPLYSNFVLGVKYDETTGDVFIGTDVGIQSFRSTILAGSETYSDLVAFPNPVRPNYNGTVLIKGLLDKSIIKITDESGNLVWETKSAGGQVEWPVTTLSGSRVTSGAYVVYASTTNGEIKALTKVLVVN